MFRGMSSDEKERLTWQSWTMVTTTVDSLTAPIDTIMPYSKSAKPSPFPMRKPAKSHRDISTFSKGSFANEIQNKSTFTVSAALFCEDIKDLQSVTKK